MDLSQPHAKFLVSLFELARIGFFELGQLKTSLCMSEGTPCNVLGRFVRATPTRVP